MANSAVFPSFQPQGWPFCILKRRRRCWLSKGKNVRNVMARGYSEAGASTTKRALRGFTPSSGSPHEDINQNNGTLRQRSRMLYMAAPVATSAINTNRTKVVGTGLTLKSSIDRDVLGISPEAAKQWQRKTEAEFRIWASKPQNCDAIGLNNFSGLQQLALTAWLMSGDVFALFKRHEVSALNPYALRVHLIEADRICTPDTYGAASMLNLTAGIIPSGQPGAGHKVYDGVEINDDGRIEAYHICSTYPLTIELNTERTWTRVPAYGSKTGLPNILQIMTSERPDQYRGVPYLAQVIEPLLQLRRYTESELMAALVQSFFTAWIETETDTAQIPVNEVGGGDIAGVPGENPESGISSSENEYEMGPGTAIHLAPGEKVQFGNPNIPTAGFETFVKSICRMIGAALEIPYDVLIKEFNSSYSASRGALLEAWEAFKMRRTWLVDRFCQPVYEVWLSEAVARSRIKAPGFFDDPLVRAAWCGARWIGPVQGQLDPKKEAAAAITLTTCGVKTHEQITRELGGGDWQENIEQLKQENELLAAAGSAAHQEISSEDDEIDDEDEDGGDGDVAHEL